MARTQRTEFVLELVQGSGDDADILETEHYDSERRALEEAPNFLASNADADCVEVARVELETMHYTYLERIMRGGTRVDLRVPALPKIHGPKAQQPTPVAIGTALGNGVVYDDGGRRAAGLRGDVGDCVARAVAIASGRDYAEVYARLAEGNATQRAGKSGKRGAKSARNGIHTKRKWFDDYMTELGFVWTPTMSIGAGCTVHLRAAELPAGRLIVSVSRHMVAVIDGVIRDAYDCTRDGKRCVYGYYRRASI